MNVKIILIYDGSSYLGWQKTKTGPSIQEAVEGALKKVLSKDEIFVEAASRTDRGVHAKGQVAHFILDEPKDLSKLQFSLNSVLPRDIRIVKLEEAPPNFHPTLDATGKEYRYQICLTPVQEPIHRLYSWHIPYPLDQKAIQEGCSLFLGEHDFSSFTTLPTENGKRTLFDAQWIPIAENRFEISLIGDRFLYKMARRIVGTLIEIGKGVMTVDQISPLFHFPNRAAAGMTAPAHGLYLNRVFYPNQGSL